MRTDKKLRRAACCVIVVICGVGVGGCGLLKPELPVKLTYRPSLVGEGVVLQLHNESPDRLVLELSFEGIGADSDESGRKTVSVGPNALVEIGWMEGVLLQPGATIVARHEKYKPSRLVLPEEIQGLNQRQMPPGWPQ